MTAAVPQEQVGEQQPQQRPPQRTGSGGSQLPDSSAASAGAGPGGPLEGPPPGLSGRETASYWYGRAHRALTQRAASPGQLAREYSHVCELDGGIRLATDAALGRGAAGRNRYCNVMPFDWNRVLLGPEGAYINASLLKVQLPTLARPCRYIATQGPLPGTCGDFWRMVWEQRSGAVVMLGNCSEGGTAKCAQYFPLAAGAKARVGGYKLQVDQQVEFSPDCTLRVMRLTDAACGQARSVSHYHLHAWPDHGTPDSSAGLRAVCRSLSVARDTAGPVVVHCSAGIGRTGTFCAVDVLLQRLDSWPACRGGGGPDRGEVEAALNVPSLVHELRKQRMGMVQTVDQYVFVYRALVDDLASRGAAA